MGQRVFRSISIGGTKNGADRLFAIAEDGSAWMSKIKLVPDSKGIGREVPGPWQRIPSLPSGDDVETWGAES